MRARFFFLLLFGLVQCGLAAQPPEGFLPPDTLVMLAVPDLAAAKKSAGATSLADLWADPAMRPFREKFAAGFDADFVKPLQRELEIDFSELAGLAQGQVTLAVTRNRGPQNQDQPLGLLLLADAGEKSADLKQRLEKLRQSWSANPARALRTEEVRGVPFTVVSLGTNALPETLRKFFPGALDYQEIGREPGKPSDRRQEIGFGRVGSVLVVGNSAGLLERVVDRLTGGASPSLADQATFQAQQGRLFRDAAVYGWMNGKALFDLALQAALAEKENPLAPNPFELFKPAKLLAGSGLAGLESIGFALRAASEGLTLQLMLGAPETSRRGILRLLAGEPKDPSMPACIPPDVVKFQRWRVDGQKIWNSFTKTLAEASPQMLNSLNFIIDTANEAANQKNPGFDLRKALLGNLGDDVIVYEKAPKEGQPGDPSEGSALYLLGSPDPLMFAASVQNVLILVTAHAGSPQEREFLGRKILSVPMPVLNLGGGESVAARGRTLHYAAGAGYVAFSSDLRLVEEYLRTPEGKTLKDTPGLAEAAQRVLAPGSSYFRFSDTRQAWRPVWESLRKGTSSPNSVGALQTVTQLPGMKTPEKRFTDWLDYSLLPPFEAVAKYLNFTVSGNETTVEGIKYTLFGPKAEF